MDDQQQIIERLDAMEEKINRVLSIVQQEFAPSTDSMIKELARQIAMGNKEAIKEYRNRYKQIK